MVLACTVVVGWQKGPRFPFGMTLAWLVPGLRTLKGLLLKGLQS